MSHHCHARECKVVVKPELLMCIRHWRMVPRSVQHAIWGSYRPGQCDDKQPSSTWHQAASAAIGYVAQLEGKKFSVNEARAMRDLGVAPERVLEGLKKIEEARRRA